MKDRLKPCPLCGGKARIMFEEDANPQYTDIYCTECGVMIWEKERADAIKKWNRRVKEDERTAD